MSALLDDEQIAGSLAVASPDLAWASPGGERTWSLGQEGSIEALLGPDARRERSSVEATVASLDAAGPPPPVQALRARSGHPAARITGTRGVRGILVCSDHFANALAVGP